MKFSVTYCKGQKLTQVLFDVLTQPASKEFDLFPALKIDQAERYYCMPDLSGSEGRKILACQALLLTQHEKSLKQCVSATSSIKNPWSARSNEIICDAWQPACV